VKLALAATLIAGTVGVFGAMTAGTVTAGTAPADSAPAGSLAPETPVTTVPETIPETIPDTASDDTDTAPGGDTLVDDDDTSVSIGWWIGGVAVAAVAAYGIAYSLRRRTVTEDWARHASVACDIGRATSLTLLTQLDEPVWSHPPRYTEQHQRFSDHLTELHRSVPDQDFPELLDAVTAANERLSDAVGQLPDGAPIEMARSSIEPAIDDLAAALDALENQASITVFGATLPSSRTTG
jgi:hypothetical protein